MKTGKALASFVHQSDIESVEFSPDGRMVVTGSYDKAAKIWDVAPETRTPEKIKEVVEKTVPFRLENGVLVTR